MPVGRFTDKANGYLVWLRLILPVLITLGLFRVGEMKVRTEEVWVKTEQVMDIISTEIRKNIAAIQQDVAVLTVKHQDTIRRVEQLEKKRQ